MNKDQKRKGISPEIFKIEVARLKKGPFLLRREIPLDWLLKELQSCEYEVTPRIANVDLKIEPTGKGILVQGKIRVEAETECAVCLAETVLVLTPEVSAFLMPKADLDEGLDDKDLTPEDLELEWFEGNAIVLDSLLRDTMVLALPMNPKCGDRCPGLTQYAASPPEPTVDPRFLPLANLIIEKEK